MKRKIVKIVQIAYFATFCLFSSVAIAQTPVIGIPGGSGGGGANFPSTQGLMVNTSTTAARTALNGVDYAATPILPAALGIYRLTEGAGTTLNDSSGNGNTATMTGTAPTWGNGGLNFTIGTTTPVNLPAALNTAQTIDVCFVRPTVFGATPQFVTAIGHTAQFGGALMLAQNGTGTPAAGQPTTYTTLFNNNSAVARNLTAIGSLPTCYAEILNSTAIVQYVNGQPAITNGTQIAASQLAASGNYVIGGDSGPGCASRTACDFGGLIVSVKLFQPQLTAAQMQVLYAADLADMAAKNVPTAPTISITATANQFDVYGDSISQGQAITTPWVSNVGALLNTTYVVHNASIGCRTATLSISTMIPDLDSFIASTGRNSLVIWLGTNDATSSGCPLTPNSATQAFATIQNLIAKAQTLGVQNIYVMTMLSRTGFDTNKNTLNGLLRTQLVGAKLIDIAAVVALGADGASANTTNFQGDGTHPTQTGANLIAPIVANAVNYWDGATASAPHSTVSNAYAMLPGDRYLTATPTAAAAYTLPACTGLSGYEWTITNNSAFAITMSGINSETINGSATIAANATGRFTCLLISPSAAGGVWARAS